MEVNSQQILQGYFESYRINQRMPEGLKRNPFFLTKLFCELSINELRRRELPPGELKLIFDEIHLCALSNELTIKKANKIHRIIQTRDRELLENSKILFRVWDYSFEGPRLLWIVKSPFIKVSLSETFGQTSKNEIIFDGFSLKTLLTINSFVEFNHLKLCKMNFEEICDLLIVAEYLQIFDLVRICEENISNLINGENIFSIIKICANSNFRILRNTCQNFLVEKGFDWNTSSEHEEYITINHFETEDLPLLERLFTIIPIEKIDITTLLKKNVNFVNLYPRKSAALIEVLKRYKGKVTLLLSNEDKENIRGWAPFISLATDLTITMKRKDTVEVVRMAGKLRTLIGCFSDATLKELSTLSLNLNELTLNDPSSSNTTDVGMEYIPSLGNLNKVKIFCKNLNPLKLFQILNRIPSLKEIIVPHSAIEFKEFQKMFVEMPFLTKISVVNNFYPIGYLEKRKFEIFSSDPNYEVTFSDFIIQIEKKGSAGSKRKSQLKGKKGLIKKQKV